VFFLYEKAQTGYPDKGKGENSKTIAMNYLNAVFWDYPQFTDSKYLYETLKNEGNASLHNWILKRFLEYGRAVDTMKYFSLHELAEKIDALKLSPYAHRKWKRLLEVYGCSKRE